MVETVKNVLKRAVPQKVHSKVSMNRLKILVTTVNRSKADFYMDYIQSFGANMQFVFYGHGTAPREIMAALGLADSERAVIISIIGECLEEKFRTIVNGKGIAYTIPMSSVIGKSVFNFLSDNRSQVGRG